MKKNRWIKIALMFVLFLGLASCGTKTGVVSYANYQSIVTVADATVDNDATTYSGVLNLLGNPTTSTYLDETDDGLLT